MKVDIFNTDKKYNIIYADPPWEFKYYSEKGAEKKSAQSHYSCMSLDDIKALPIKDIAEKNCVLLMWVTYPFLEKGFEVIKAWGFEYKTCGFTWVKKCKKSDGWFFGCGNWTRANAEICLLATKGKPKRVSASVRQVCDARIMEHSKKPPEIRDRIVQLCGDLPRIELFARQYAEGWDCWGNEAPEHEIREVI